MMTGSDHFITFPPPSKLNTVMVYLCVWDLESYVLIMHWCVSTFLDQWHKKPFKLWSPWCRVWHSKCQLRIICERLEIQIRTLQINMRGNFKIKHRKGVYANFDSVNTFREWVLWALKGLRMLLTERWNCCDMCQPASFDIKQGHCHKH